MSCDVFNSARVVVWVLRWPHRAERCHADTSATPRPKHVTQKKGARLVVEYLASVILTFKAVLMCCEYNVWFPNTSQAVIREELLIRDVRRALEGVTVEDVYRGVRQRLPVPPSGMRPSAEQKNSPRPALRLATTACYLATLQRHFLWQWVF